MKSLRLPLSKLLDTASGHLAAHLLHKKETAPSDVAGTAAYAGIIFSGNPHEAVPRRLLLDDRLTPLERNTWQVFRLLINGDGVTAFPTYDQLRPYLGMQPGKSASRETISKSLVTLRLTRWLSLGRRVRSDLSGRVQGNVYLLHDEPVSPAEAIELDRDYLQLLSQSMKHQNKAIREVAQLAWNEFAADPDVGNRLPSRMDVIEERLNSQRFPSETGQPLTAKTSEFGIRTQPLSTPSSLSSESEPSPNSVESHPTSQSSDAQLSLKPGSTLPVRNPNSYSTYTDTNNVVCKRSVPVPHEHDDAVGELLHACDRLPVAQRHEALSALQKVPSDLKVALLSQWVHRLNSGSLRNPLAYLLTLVTNAIRGDFNSTWTPDQGTVRGDSATAKPNSPASSPSVERPSAPPLLITPREIARTPEKLATARHEINAMINTVKFGRPNAP